MRKRRDEWLGLVDDWRTTGENQVMFAERHGVPVATFRYWVARHRELAEAREHEGVQGHRARFVPVSAAKARDGHSARCHVRMGTVDVWFDEPPPVQWLRALAGLPC